MGDKTALNDEKTSYERTLSSMLELRAATVYPTWKDSCPCDGCHGKLYAFADEQGVTICVAGVRDSQYPERVVNQLLKDFAEKSRNSQGNELLNEARSGSLSKPLKNTMRDLMSQYGSATSHDKTTEVRAQVDQLKGIMQDNVKRILETHVTLDQLQNSSQNMSSQANQFLRQSVDLRRQVQFRNLKVKVLMGVCAGGVIAYFALPFF